FASGWDPGSGSAPVGPPTDVAAACGVTTPRSRGCHPASRRSGDRAARPRRRRGRACPRAGPACSRRGCRATSPRSRGGRRACACSRRRGPTRRRAPPRLEGSDPWSAASSRRRPARRAEAELPYVQCTHIVPAMENVQRTYTNDPDRSTAPRPTMRAVVHDRYGPPDVLAVRTIDVPGPGPDEVLVRVAAASVNPLDWHFLTGTPYLVRLMAGLRRPKRPVRGVDVAGIVVEVGAGVAELAVGDRVFGSARGSFAEYATASVKHLARIPDGLDDGEAAAMPIAAITAL